MTTVPLRVLVVDDDEDDYALIRDLLLDIEPDGFAVQWASSYEAAWTAMEADRHDLYLLNYRLGAYTGLDLLRAARQRDCRAPLILLTGQNDAAVDVEAIREGAADYLVKGHFDAALLSRSIRHALEHARTLQALRESEQRFRAAVNAGTDAFFIFSSVRDAEGRIVDFRFAELNTRAERLLNMPRADVQGRELCALFPANRSSGLFDRYVEVVETGAIFETEYHLTSPQLAASWVQIQAAPLADGVVVTTIDISARKQAELDLRDSEERFRSAFEDAAIGMALVSLEGRWTRVNHAVCAMLGFSNDEMLATTFQEITHPDDLDADLSLVQQLLAGERRTYQLEKRYFRKDRRLVWVLLNVSLVRDVNGAPWYFVSQIQDITERKQAEQSLQTSEATNRALLNAIPDLMFRISRAGTFLEYNVNHQNGLMLPPSEFVGKNLGDLFPAALVQETLAHIERALQTGDVQVFEYDLPVDDRSHSWEARVGVCGPEEVLVIVRNITKRKQAEAALKQQRDFAQQVLNTMGQGLTIADAEGCFEYVNPAYARMLGYSPDELIGQRPRDLIYPEDQLALCDLRRSGPGSRPHVFEARHRRRDGTLIHALVTRVPRWHNDVYTGTIAVVSNLTERKRSEERLAQLAAIVESSDDAIVSKTLDGVITSWNRGAERLYGYTAQEAIGRSIALTVPRGRMDEVDRIMARLRDGEHVNHYDSERIRKDGSVVPVSQTHSLVKDGSGAIIGISTIARDITERKKIDRMKDEFVATVSHELRTPLTSIKGYVDLIREGDAGPISPQIDEFLEIVQCSADRLVQITNDMLETARLESGKIKLNLHTVRLDQLLPSIARALQPLVSDKDQRLTIDVPADLPSAQVDRERVGQIVTNLLSNAHKYTPRGGSIRLSVQQLAQIADDQASDGHNGPWLLVEVSDTGIGIAPDDQRNLFTRFFRTSNPALQGVGGTGLGLYITRSLVELHGGRIWVQSTPGKGTTFSFTLRAANTPPAALPAPHDTPNAVVSPMYHDIDL